MPKSKTKTIIIKRLIKNGSILNILFALFLFTDLIIVRNFQLIKYFFVSTAPLVYTVYIHSHDRSITGVVPDGRQLQTGLKNEAGNAAKSSKDSNPIKVETSFSTARKRISYR